MTKPTLIQITSIAEYVSVISKINAAEQDCAWFRGHSSATHRLVPSVLRKTALFRSGYGEKLRGDERLTASGSTVTGISPERMLDDFKRKALPFLQYSPKNDFEWLFLMQHHGVPTRLLDWTTNALVALYFAVSSLRAGSFALKPDDPEDEADVALDEFDEYSAAVFAMNPNKVNSVMHSEIDQVVDIAQNFNYWKPYSSPMTIGATDFDTQWPLCINAPQISARIRAQSGLFSIHGMDVSALDYIVAVRPLLTKILIPFRSAQKIQEELHQFGVTESFIYPSLESVARDVWADEVRRHGWDRKNYREELDKETDKRLKAVNKPKKVVRGKKGKS